MIEEIPSPPSLLIPSRITLRDNTRTLSKRSLPPKCENEKRLLKQRSRGAKKVAKLKFGIVIVNCCHICYIKQETLRMYICKSHSVGRRGGYNKLLENQQNRAIHNYLRIHLLSHIQPTMGLVSHTICQLKKVDDPV